MSITRIPALQSGGVWYELRPTVKFARGAIMESAYHVREFSDIAGGAPGLIETKSQIYGQEIQVSGQENFTDMASALVFQELLESLLIGPGGRARAVEVCEWVDSEGERLGIWRQCVLSGAIRWPEVSTIRRFKYDFTLRSPYPFRFSTATDGTVPESSVYAAYHASTNYSLGGQSIVPTGSVVIMNKTASQILVSFPTIVDEATGANTENVARLQRRVVLSTRTAMMIRSVHIRNAVPAESGGATTTARVANAAQGQAVSGVMTCSVGAAETYCASVTTGGFSVAAGVPVWVYFTAAGGHSAVEIILEVEPL